MNKPTDTLNEAFAPDPLDDLIRETVDRRELIADLDRMIIADVRQRVRRARLRRWARILAFSSGLPLALLVFFAFAYYYIHQHGWTSMTIWVMLWPTLALLFCTHRALATFSPDEV